MKTIHYLSIIILSFSSQILLAQNDTLVGVLRDISDKIIKRYPVTLGSQNPITVKTNKHGVFTIPGANLNDTLFVTIKKTRNVVKVPVNGYNYITITLEKHSHGCVRNHRRMLCHSSFVVGNRDPGIRFSVSLLYS